jgi:hypothetical protein
MADRTGRHLRPPHLPAAPHRPLVELEPLGGQYLFAPRN